MNNTKKIKAFHDPFNTAYNTTQLMNFNKCQVNAVNVAICMFIDQLLHTIFFLCGYGIKLGLFFFEHYGQNLAF